MDSAIFGLYLCVLQLFIAVMILLASVLQLFTTNNAKKRWILYLNILFVISLIGHFLTSHVSNSCIVFLITSSMPLILGVIEVSYITELVLVAAKRVEKLFELMTDRKVHKMRFASFILSVLIIAEIILIGVTDLGSVSMIKNILIGVYASVLMAYNAKALWYMRVSFLEIITLVDATLQDMAGFDLRALFLSKQFKKFQLLKLSTYVDYETARGIKTKWLPVLRESSSRMTRQLIGTVFLGLLAVTAQIYELSLIIRRISQGKLRWCSLQQEFVSSTTFALFEFAWFALPIYALSYVWIPMYLVFLTWTNPSDLNDSHSHPSRLATLSISFEGKRGGGERGSERGSIGRRTNNNTFSSGRRGSATMATLFEENKDRTIRHDKQKQQEHQGSRTSKEMIPGQHQQQQQQQASLQPRDQSRPADHKRYSISNKCNDNYSKGSSNTGGHQKRRLVRLATSSPSHIHNLHRPTPSPQSARNLFSTMGKFQNGSVPTRSTVTGTITRGKSVGERIRIMKQIGWQTAPSRRSSVKEGLDTKRGPSRSYSPPLSRIPYHISHHRMPHDLHHLQRQYSRFHHRRRYQ
eukprot:jgi/Bigna1/89003/estExt_fgenesh1_pg.C_420049